MERLLGVIGFSGAGKTTLVERLIQRYTSTGTRVSAVKHTHHAVTGFELKGDTERFIRAGAIDSILADNRRFLHWQEAAVANGTYGSFPELFERCLGQRIFIEGRKLNHSWPVIIKASSPEELRELWSPFAIAVCANSPIGTPFNAIPQIHCDDVDELVKIVDRIDP